MTDTSKETQKQQSQVREDPTAEQLRQGRIVLHNRRRKIIFFSGLALLVLFIIALRIAG